MRTQLLVTALLGLAAATPAFAVFTDTFASGTAADAGYYRFGTTGTTLAAAGGDLDFAYDGTAASRSGLIKSFSAQTLGVGDSITFSFDVTSRTLGSAQNHAFRWAIGNLGNPSAVTGAPVTGDLASATPFASGTRLMYQFSASTGTTAGFGQFVSATTSPVHNNAGSATAISGFSGPASVATTGASSVSLTITRTATGDYSISQTAFGASSSGTLTGAGGEIFNTIAFSMNNAGTLDFSLDNISVSYSAIPEPSAFAALAGLGALGFIGMRRRRV